MDFGGPEEDLIIEEAKSDDSDISEKKNQVMPKISLEDIQINNVIDKYLKKPTKKAKIEKSYETPQKASETSDASSILLISPVIQPQNNSYFSFGEEAKTS